MLPVLPHPGRTQHTSHLGPGGPFGDVKTDPHVPVTCPTSHRERADTVVLSRGQEAWLIASLLPTQGYFPSNCLFVQRVSPLRTSCVKKHKKSSLDPSSSHRHPIPPFRPTSSFWWACPPSLTHSLLTLLPPPCPPPRFPPCALPHGADVTVLAAKPSHMASHAHGHLLATFPRSSIFGPSWPHPWQPHSFCSCK